jgi:hypothetical protein
VYQQAGSKVGAWLDRYVPFVSKTWKAFSMLGDLGKVIAGGATVAALLFGGTQTGVFESNSSVCPDGWAYNEAIEGDSIRRTCYQVSTGWSVLLAPNSNDCESALKTNDPRATKVECSAVPGW